MTAAARRLQARVAELPPGAFSIVMATGVVSTAARLLGAPWLARLLLALNAALYLVLVALSLWRIAAFPARVRADFASHARAPSFLTAAAGTCVLGSGLVVAGQPAVAAALWAIGLALWAGLLYALLLVLIVHGEKPALAEGLNGTWLLIVVATQSVSVLGTLLAPALGRGAAPALAFAAAAFTVGGLLYVVLLSLVLYRFLFFPLTAAQLTPPYWIAMGAAAISTLAAALLVLASRDAAVLGQLRPFLTGATVAFWSMATWWIPLLLLLGAWRHVARHTPLRYDVGYWSAVFPLGMYTVATLRFADALDWPFLAPLARLAGAAALVAWVAAFTGLLQSLRARGGDDVHGPAGCGTSLA